MLMIYKSYWGILQITAKEDRIGFNYQYLPLNIYIVTNRRS